MTDFAERVGERIRREWPGERVLGDGTERFFPPVRAGGSTDALIRFAEDVIESEIDELPVAIVQEGDLTEAEIQSFFDRLQRQIGRGNAARGFREESERLVGAHNLDHDAIRNYQVTKLALGMTELSEAIEELRLGRDVDETFYTDKSPTPLPDSARFDYQGHLRKPEGVPSEVADTVIRMVDFADEWGFSLGWIINEKLAFNDTRPYKHGKTV